MCVERAKSSFVADKASDPTFLLALGREREMLCNQLDRRRSGALLAKALRGCSQQACGLAACPICMARFDRQLFARIDGFCMPPRQTMVVASAPLCGFNYRSTASDLLPAVQKVSETLKEPELEIRSFLGRFNLIYNPYGSYSRFIGAVEMSYASSEYRREDMFDSHSLRRLNGGIYDLDNYQLIDKNLLTMDSRIAGRNLMSSTDDKECVEIEAKVALLYGHTKCEDLLLEAVEYRRVSS